MKSFTYNLGNAHVPPPLFTKEQLEKLLRYISRFNPGSSVIRDAHKKAYPNKYKR